MSASPISELTTDELLGLRMRALGLDLPRDLAPGAPQAATVTDVADRMLALQGQDWRASRWALGLRAPGATVADVHAAFDAGHLVRSWPMRGTVHVVPAADIGWMQEATNARQLAGAPRRREALGMSDAVLDRLVETSVEAMRTAPQTRTTLSEAWTEAGIDWKGNWRYHVIWWLCQTGIAVFGPTADGEEPRLVLAEAWISQPRRLSGDAALAELATRHAAGRGPVRTKDFAWWTGLPVREARRGIALAAEAGRLVPVKLTGSADAAGEFWVTADLLDSAPVGSSREQSIGNWLLLPAFDEHLLGYTLRDPQLDPADFERVLPGRNGMFLATIVRGGRVVGTWRRGTGKHAGPELTAFPWATLDHEALAPAIAHWAHFHGLDVSYA